MIATLEKNWEVIFDEIRAWMSKPGMLADEDGIVPSEATIRLAYDLAQKLASAGESDPIVVVPDGNAGITFEWEIGSASRWIEIRASGQIEEIIIRDGRVSRRQFVSSTE